MSPLVPPLLKKIFRLPREGGGSPLKKIFNRGGTRGDRQFWKILEGDAAYRGGDPPCPPI